MIPLIRIIENAPSKIILIIFFIENDDQWQLHFLCSTFKCVMWRQNFQFIIYNYIGLCCHHYIPLFLQTSNNSFPVSQNYKIFFYHISSHHLSFRLSVDLFSLPGFYFMITLVFSFSLLLMTRSLYSLSLFLV